MKNYYAILEVPVGCSLEEVRQAYRRLAQGSLDDEAAFADLKEAYEVLTTPTRRAEYDQAAWGETFTPGTGTDALLERAADRTLNLTAESSPARTGRCPMGAEAQCPVLQGHVGVGDKFCPECGYLLSSLGAGDSFDTAGVDAPDRAVRLEGADGQTHRLRAGLNLVGREAADVLLPDKTVSRQHARLEVSEAGVVTVSDLGSTNGTQVNGATLTPHVPRALLNGDQVRFGSVGAEIRLPASEAPPQEANAAAPETPADPPGTARARIVEMREDDPRTFFLVPGVTTFGRRAENSVVLLGDPYVSGSHAQIIAEGDVFRLTDVGSTNGTLRNGERLAINEPAPLGPGDVILIGGTAFRFEVIPEAAPEQGLDQPETDGGDAPIHAAQAYDAPQAETLSDRDAFSEHSEG